MTNPMEMFQQGTGAQFPYEEHLGQLLIITPTNFEEKIPTIHGESDAVRANILVVDGPDAGEQFDDVLIFPRVLVSVLRGKIGSPMPVLGRLAQGEAKRGQSAPWILGPFTEEDAAAAVAAMSGKFGGEKATTQATTQATAVAATPVAVAQQAAVTALTAQQRELAEKLLASGTPAELVADATGTTLQQLAAAGLVTLV